jgi:tryptophan halogenase
MNKKNLVVVGGGTAGWFTALYAKKIFPEKEIVLIESEKIGILGAGEASTFHLIKFLDFLEIPASEIIKHAGATIKNAAKFTGWSKNEKEHFYHPFKYFDSSASEFTGYFDDFELNTNAYHLYAYIKNYSMDEYCLINKLSNNNLVPFVKNNLENQENKILNYDQLGGWSLNFDASLLAKYLRGVAESRGIKRIEGIVENIVLNEEGDVSEILLKGGKKIYPSFVFDCTGFAKIFIGKKYKSKWISYKEYLPTNKALPFFINLDNEENIPPYIEAIAMDYGWMWKTPLQHRYGCGYVFDDSYISEDEAKKEVEKKIGIEVNVPKIFSFEPGCYEKVWINNCLSIGLASGFVEPLEATSLYQTIRSLQYFFSNKNNIFTKNINIKNKFNKTYQQDSFSIVEYIYWHYTTNKDNTDFWKFFVEKNKTPEKIFHLLEIIKERAIDFNDLSYDSLIFEPDDFLYVLYGHKMFSKKIANKYTKNVEKFLKSYNNLKSYQDRVALSAMNHNAFIKELKNS